MREAERAHLVLFSLSSRDIAKKTMMTNINTLGLYNLVGGKNKISLSDSMMMLRRKVEQVMGKEYPGV